MKKFLLLFAAIFAVCIPAWADAQPFQIVPFETLGLGTQSGCTHEAKILISDEREWARVWKIHAGSDLPAPKVDFKTQAVVAILAGEQRAPGATIEIAQIVRTPNDTVVYFYADQNAPDGKPVQPSQPFHFAAIAKPSGPLKFANAAGLTCTDCHP